MKGRTTVIVAHRLTTITGADKIVVLENGQIVQQGTHTEMIAVDGPYSQLVQRQAQSMLQQSQGNTSSAPEEEEEEAVVVAAPGEGEPKQDAKKPTEAGHAPVSAMRVLRYRKDEWPALALGIATATVNGLVIPTFAFLLSHVLKVFYIENLDRMKSQIELYVLLFVGLAVVAATSEATQQWLFALYGERLTRQLRDESFSTILRQQIAFFDDPAHSTGALTTSLATDATLVRGMVTKNHLVVQGTVTFVATMAIAFTYGWQLSLVMLAIVPCILAAGYLQTAFFSGFTAESLKSYAEAGKIVNESVGGMRTVASCTGERQAAAAYEKALAGPAVLGVRRSHVAGLGFGFSSGVMFFAYALAFWYGGVLIEDGETEFGDVMRVIFTLMFGMFQLGQVSSFMPDTGKAQAATRAIFALLDRRSAIDALSTAGQRLERVKGDIELRGVAFAYPTRPGSMIYSGLDLTVPAGTSVALVGPSGCGKSTVVSLLQRFYDPTGGSILLDGHDTQTLNVGWLREQMGLVSQEPTLFDGSVQSNILYSREDASETEMVEAAKAANAHEFIMKLPQGYQTDVGERGVQLSGGQKQRIAIARALIRNPAILLLDEATSALDTESERVVQDALDRVMRGRTTIIIAHRLSTVKNASKIVVLDRGAVVEQGTHDELVALRGAYFSLIQKQGDRVQ
eukprot:TRINITY_DN48_c0_g1_i2.p1 TRINITY_DN48_c0_g1~~TRINITY_DN48_c0_g1_i2.p1  ORF type:complete len:683 (+),score=216.00 TRINITY_DN48_c0_g1_i2:1720-3768(+)